MNEALKRWVEENTIVDDPTELDVEAELDESIHSSDVDHPADSGRSHVEGSDYSSESVVCIDEQDDRTHSTVFDIQADPFSQTRCRDGVLNGPHGLGVKPIDETTVLVSMTDDVCPCCGGFESSNAESERSSNRWIADASPLETELPPELQSALGRFLGMESVETLGEWASEVRDRTGDGSITVDDLCLTDEETVHRGTVGNQRYHFACFYDAVILAALLDRPVDIRTESPDGTGVEARAVGTEELTVRPSKAVFSFGIDDTVMSSVDGETPSLERGYAAICPYVNAFPTPAAYEEWARSVPAATVAMPLEGATDLAAELVR